MKLKTLTLIVFSVVAVSAYAQNIPLDEKTGKAVYTEVVQVDGAGQQELYDRALHWFSTYFQNPASVIKVKEPENGKISGQHGIYIFKSLEEQTMQHKVGQVRYSVEIQARDGRYKYTINDIFKLASPKVYLEDWLKENNPDKASGPIYAKQVDNSIQDLLKNMKATMAQPVPKDEKEDW